jgi:hypothetical protein
MKVELIKDLGDGWTTGLAYTKAWDKDGYLEIIVMVNQMHQFQIRLIRHLQSL